MLGISGDANKYLPVFIYIVLLLSCLMHNKSNNNFVKLN